MLKSLFQNAVQMLTSRPMNVSEKKCPFLDFTSCENTLCYINEKSEMEEGVLFGGDMESDGDNKHNIERWKRISSNAVIASYEEYMRQKSNE